MSTAGREPRFGSRLLPQVVDDLAQLSPNRVYASVPISSDLSMGFQDVTMLDMSRAVDYFAWWLEDRIGRSTEFETLSYMSVPDLRYAVVFLAAVKCGYKGSAGIIEISGKPYRLTAVSSFFYHLYATLRG